MFLFHSLHTAFQRPCGHQSAMRYVYDRPYRIGLMEIHEMKSAYTYTLEIFNERESTSL